MLDDDERAEVRGLLEGMRRDLEERVEQLTRSSQPVSLEDPIGIDRIRFQPEVMRCVRCS